MAEKQSGDEQGIAGGGGKPTPGSDAIQHDDKSSEHVSKGEPASCVDEDSEESFPASDPPSFTPGSHLGQPKKGPVKQKKWQ